MDGTKILTVLSRQRVAVAAVFVLGILAFIVVTPLIRKYTAQSTVLAASTSPQQASALDPSKDPTTAAVQPADLPALAVSAPVLDRVAADLGWSQDSVISLARKIKMRAPLQSNVLPIVFTDKDPQVAINGVNFVARELVRYERELSTARYDQLIADLNGQLVSRKLQLDRLDRQISEVAGADPYVASDGDNTPLRTHRLALEQQRAMLAAAVNGDEAAIQIVQRRPGLTKDLAGQEIVHQDPTYDTLKLQYGKDLAQLNNVEAGYTDDFPGLSGARELVARERKSLDSAIRNVTSNPDKSPTYVTALIDANKAKAQFASDSAELSSIDLELSKITADVSGPNSSTAHIAELRRDRDVAEASYEALESNLTKASADRAQASAINSIVIVEPATYSQMVIYAKPLVAGAFFLLLTIWAAISVAYMLDKVDSRLTSDNDIEKLYGIPVVAPIS